MYVFLAFFFFLVWFFEGNWSVFCRWNLSLRSSCETLTATQTSANCSPSCPGPQPLFIGPVLNMYHSKHQQINLSVWGVRQTGRSWHFQCGAVEELGGVEGNLGEAAAASMPHDSTGESWGAGASNGQFGEEICGKIGCVSIVSVPFHSYCFCTVGDVLGTNVPCSEVLVWQAGSEVVKG